GHVRPNENIGVGQVPAHRPRTLHAQRNSPTRTRLHCLRSFGAVRTPRKGEVSFVLDPQVLENRMCKGGGSSSTIDPAIKNLLTQNVTSARAVANRPYQPYMGP